MVSSPHTNPGTSSQFHRIQPAFTKIVQYRVIDCAPGTVEKGWYHNDDAYNSQPCFPTDRFRTRSHGDSKAMNRLACRTQMAVQSPQSRATERGSFQTLTKVGHRHRLSSARARLLQAQASNRTQRRLIRPNKAKQWRPHAAKPQSWLAVGLTALLLL